MSSYYVSEIVRIRESAKFSPAEETDTPQAPTLGGIFSNNKHAWLTFGARFEAYEINSGKKAAAWTFGSILRDTGTKITCIAELQRNGRTPLLVVGLECFLSGGMLCIFDIIGSRVLRALQISNKVSCVEVIDSGSDVCLPGPLRAFDGVLAVGTCDGAVLLIDLCRSVLDDGGFTVNVKDEVDPCQILILEQTDIELIESRKQATISSDVHLALHLNAVYDVLSPHFILKGPKWDDRLFVNKREVVVSALHYCPQMGSLLVGYNFGAIQIWNLLNLKLVYTSPVYEENTPVSHFCIQEPSDDPRAFCYMWAVYSNNESFQPNFPVAVLYSLYYDSKEWHEGYGYLYQDLVSCSVRLQFDLDLIDKRVASSPPQGAHCLKLCAIQKGISLKNNSLNEPQEESLTVCSIVWTVWCSPKETYTYMALFDLNQWYKEQMPNSPNARNSVPYMTHFCLHDLMFMSGGKRKSILDVQIDKSTVNQYVGSQKLEEHYYPASMMFNFYSFSEFDIMLVKNRGVHQALLLKITSAGPMALANPKQFYDECVNLGLTPLFVDIFPGLTTVNFQREFLLNVLLEQHLVHFLCKWASAWANGSYASVGCTLDMLLRWAWERSTLLKNNADKICIQLFDYSGSKLDANANRYLTNCESQLGYLTILFNHFLKSCSTHIHDTGIVQRQWELLQMTSKYFDVLRWLLNVGLLPECSMTTLRMNDLSAPYPVESLVKYYTERRLALQSLDSDCPNNKNLLFIDKLIQLECGGNRLQRFWQEDGGSGLYPPPSLQSLLRTYFVEHIEISLKHCLVVYLFLDLAMTLDQNRYKSIITHLIKFPAVFQLSPSVIKITQAFWQLDHGDFATAMEQLLDPLICANDLKLWHHRLVMKTLLLQKEARLALFYMQVRRPPLIDVQDMCLAISLYITNNSLDEAFQFLRENIMKENEKQLLQHFFNECNKNNLLRSILQFSLISAEEAAFMNYLQDSKHPEEKDLKVSYYLQRSCYADALECNERHELIRAINKGLLGQGDATLRDCVMDKFSNILLPVTKTIIDISRKEKRNLTRGATKPTPLSMLVHDTNNQIKYKSSFLYDCILQSKMTWSHETPNATITETTPFLRTPSLLTPLRARKSITPMIYQKRVESQYEENVGPTPLKLIKLNDSGKSSSLDWSKWDTPTVKRKVSRERTSQPGGKYRAVTPHSILKMRSFAELNSELDNSEESLKPVSVIHGSAALTPRPAVRFQDLGMSSSISNASLESTKSVDEELHQEMASAEEEESPTKRFISARKSYKEKSPDDLKEDETTRTPSFTKSKVLVASLEAYDEKPLYLSSRFVLECRKSIGARNSLTRQLFENNLLSRISNISSKSLQFERVVIQTETDAPTTTRDLKEESLMEHVSVQDSDEKEMASSSPKEKGKESIPQENIHLEGSRKNSFGISNLSEFKFHNSDVSDLPFSSLEEETPKRSRFLVKPRKSTEERKSLTRKLFEDNLSSKISNVSSKSLQLEKVVTQTETDAPTTTRDLKEEYLMEHVSVQDSNKKEMASSSPKEKGQKSTPQENIHLEGSLESSFDISDLAEFNFHNSDVSDLPFSSVEEETPGTVRRTPSKVFVSGSLKSTKARKSLIRQLFDNDLSSKISNVLSKSLQLEKPVIQTETDALTTTRDLKEESLMEHVSVQDSDKKEMASSSPKEKGQESTPQENIHLKSFDISDLAEFNFHNSDVSDLPFSSLEEETPERSRFLVKPRKSTGERLSLTWKLFEVDLSSKISNVSSKSLQHEKAVTQTETDAPTTARDLKEESLMEHVSVQDSDKKKMASSSPKEKGQESTPQENIHLERSQEYSFDISDLAEFNFHNSDVSDLPFSPLEEETPGKVFVFGPLKSTKARKSLTRQLVDLSSKISNVSSKSLQLEKTVTQTEIDAPTTTRDLKEESLMEDVLVQDSDKKEMASLSPKEKGQESTPQENIHLERSQEYSFDISDLAEFNFHNSDVSDLPFSSLEEETPERSRFLVKHEKRTGERKSLTRKLFEDDLSSKISTKLLQLEKSVTRTQTNCTTTSKDLKEESLMASTSKVNDVIEKNAGTPELVNKHSHSKSSSETKKVVQIKSDGDAEDSSSDSDLLFASISTPSFGTDPLEQEKKEDVVAEKESNKNSANILVEKDVHEKSDSPIETNLDKPEMSKKSAQTDFSECFLTDSVAEKDSNNSSAENFDDSVFEHDSINPLEKNVRESVFKKDSDNSLKQSSGDSVSEKGFNNSLEKGSGNRVAQKGLNSPDTNAVDSTVDEEEVMMDTGEILDIGGYYEFSDDSEPEQMDQQASDSEYEHDFNEGFVDDETDSSEEADEPSVEIIELDSTSSEESSSSGLNQALVANLIDKGTNSEVNNSSVEVVEADLNEKTANPELNSAFVGTLNVNSENKSDTLLELTTTELITSNSNMEQLSHVQQATMVEEETPSLTENAPKPYNLRKRTVSTDTIESQPSKKAASTKSLPIKHNESPQKRKPLSLHESESTIETPTTSSTSMVEEYSTSRRLTRRQMSMLQKTFGSEPRKPNVPGIDPLTLLERENFAKTPDLDELAKKSPSSSLTGSATGLRSSSRIRDKAAKSSSETLTSCSELGTPKKRRNTPLRKNIRSISIDEPSTSTTPQKRVTRRCSQDANDSASNASSSSSIGSIRRSQRIAGKPPSPEVSEPARKISKLKTELPKITEEDCD